MSKVYVYLASWCEDYETHGTDVVDVRDELIVESSDVNFADEVQVWEGGKLVEERWWCPRGWSKPV